MNSGTSKKVVVTDQKFGGVTQERAVAEQHGAEFSEHQCTTEAETVAAVRGAHLVFNNFAPVTSAVLTALAPGATVVRYGIGYDNVDLAAATAAGVRVANVPDYGGETVADHAAACLLVLLKLIRFDALVRERGWATASDGFPLPGLSSTTVGLIGVGRIGLAVHHRLRAFGIQVLAYDPMADRDRLAAAGVKLVELPELLAASHAISLHAPATPETQGIVNDDTIRQMRTGVFLVNTSRGGLVNQPALIRGLQSGQVGGAALDVFDTEPLAADSPLRTTPGVLLTPHVAFYSDDSLKNLQRLAAEEGGRALSGQPLRCPLN